VSPAPPQPPVVALAGLSKRFGGTLALDGVDLDFLGGEVHALVGQNGSGKSTLIKILSGFHSPDAGSLKVNGAPVTLPAAAGELRQLGIQFVHQDLALVPTMSVLENLRLGRFSRGALGRIHWRSERATARRALARFALGVDPSTPLGDLTEAERAVVAIARAVQAFEAGSGRGMLVLDEPTAALPEKEVKRLFDAVREVAASGSAVLFVTHDVGEVLTIADRVSVLRDGRLAGTRATFELDEGRLVELILGRELGELYPPVEHRTGETALEVTGLSGAVATAVDLRVRKGEVLGVTGLAGAGHDEIPYLLCGARPRRAGTIKLEGRELTSGSPAASKRAGLALLPADRQRLGGIGRATVRENVTLTDLPAFRRGIAIDRRRERTAVEEVLARFSVTPAEPERALYTLSGGNQQKALLARWLRNAPRVLLLHEPTQGVDVGARKGIFEILRAAASDGTSILYASTEYEDLANVCDRVLVLRRGRVVAELTGERLTQDHIVKCCYHGG
jgi:ribose transport system ATP-binding protein